MVMVDFNAERSGGSGQEDDSLVIALADLLPDASGEVVFFAGDDMAVNLVTKETLQSEGVADPHVTATGVDVTGLYFYSFESGVTVYSPGDLLIVQDS